jgi:hypothetical protein
MILNNYRKQKSVKYIENYSLLSPLKRRGKFTPTVGGVNYIFL